MASIHFDEHSTISVNGIDLSGAVADIWLDPEPMADRIGSLLDGLQDTSIQFTGLWDASADRLPFALAPAPVMVRFRPLDMRRWRAWWRASRPQISRMRTAYGRRHGRGRW